MKEVIRILAIGDIYGKPGRNVYRERFPALKEKYHPHLIIVNGENSAGGRGINGKAYRAIKETGADVITTGNHIFDNKGFEEVIDNPDVIVAYNFPEESPGNRIFSKEILGKKVYVITLLGRVFMDPRVECPFRKALEAMENDPNGIYIVDFHAEATSEKTALGFHLDGKYALVFGTHTHVQTADEKILPGGTAYITDIGMTGGTLSVIGADPRKIVPRFMYPHYREKADPCKQGLMVQGIYVEIDPESGKAIHIERFSI